MSSNFELLGKYDVKERQFSKVEIRNCVNGMYKECDLRRGMMKAHLNCEELFGVYFEQFDTEFTNLLAVIGFLHEVHMMDIGVYDGVMYRMDEMLEDVQEMFKVVYYESDG